jgi:hypothetical protein
VREVHGQKAQVILDNIFRLADKFGGGKSWEDDTTAVVVTRDATPPAQPLARSS